MADEPENLVLVQLRDIRAKLGEIDELKRRFDLVDKRFDRLDKNFDEMRVYVNHALGLGTMNDLKARELDARVEAGEALSRRLDERFKDIEHRLSKVEEKVD